MSASLEHGMWGPWPTVRMTTSALQLEVASEVGARVIALRDLRRDREWLLAGPAPSEAEARDWSAETAVFSGARSFGWDECLPSVAVCADPRDTQAAPLRDHGDQWGRGAYLRLDDERGAMEHRWSAPRWPYRLSRRLSCPADDAVLAEYALTSRADEALPFLWSQHPVFALEPGCRLDLPGVERASLTWQHGIDLPAEPAWPLATTKAGGSIDLATVRRGEGWAAKLYVAPSGPVSVTAPDDARLTLDWDRASAPVLGVWLAYGGWPVDGPPVEQVALEPTTSADDHLAGALARGRSRWLEPGETATWWVSLHLA